MYASWILVFDQIKVYLLQACPGLSTAGAEKQIYY